VKVRSFLGERPERSLDNFEQHLCLAVASLVDPSWRSALGVVDEPTLRSDAEGIAGLDAASGLQASE